MNIGIVGLGLIGGSLGFDLRSRGHRILGVSRRASTCDRAIARGLADTASPALSSLKTADVVFLCTPLGVMAATLQAMQPHLAAHTIVTDVGSVKGWVVETLSPLWPAFVGGHPMAGTAESGIEAAQTNLFVNAPYVLTPIAQTPPAAVQVVETLVQQLGSRLYHATPADHDRAVAWISHLPVMVSASLIAACQTEPQPPVRELAQAIASSGFRDTSRVGGGNPELGVMMAQYNQAALVRSLHSYRAQLDDLIQQIEQGHWETLMTHLAQTQRDRPHFL